MNIVEACVIASKIKPEEWPIELIEARWQGVSIFGEVFAVPLGVDLVELLAGSGMVQSKRRAREDLQNGVVRLNGKKVVDLNHKIVLTDLREGKLVDAWWMVVSVGKFNHRIFEVRWPWLLENDKETK